MIQQNLFESAIFKLIINYIHYRQQSNELFYQIKVALDVFLI